MTPVELLKEAEAKLPKIKWVETTTCENRDGPGSSSVCGDVCSRVQALIVHAPENNESKRYMLLFKGRIFTRRGAFGATLEEAYAASLSYLEECRIDLSTIEEEAIKCKPEQV